MNGSAERKILILIPVYNHGKSLRDVVKKSLSLGWPVLVVDDGSTDNSWQRLAGLDCYRLRFPDNRGKGAAILAGARQAHRLGFEMILTLDADGQHDPAAAYFLAEKARQDMEPTIIIGSRQMDHENVPAASRFGRNFSNFWVRLECGQDVDDSQSGMRLYPIKELLELPLHKLGYDFEVEVLVKAAWAGLHIQGVDVPVYYPPPGERISHFHQFRDNWRSTRLHTMLVLRRLLPWPHKKIVESPRCQRKKEVFPFRSPLAVLRLLCREHASPFWLAAAVWMGFFLGCLPLIACHTVVIIYVTHRLHLNKVAAVAASQFCAPPLVPVLCIQTGYFLRKGELLLDLSWQTWLLEIHHRLWDWFLGSLLIGPLLGLLGGGLMYWAMARYRLLRQRRQASA